MSTLMSSIERAHIQCTYCCSSCSRVLQHRSVAMMKCSCARQALNGWGETDVNRCEQRCGLPRNSATGSCCSLMQPPLSGLVDITELFCSAGWWVRSTAVLPAALSHPAVSSHYEIILHSDWHCRPACSQLLDLNICSNATMLTMKSRDGAMELKIFEPQFDIHLAQHNPSHCDAF